MKFILREIYFISEPQNLILKKTHTFIGKITFYKSVYYFHISRLQQQFKIKRKSIILTIQRVWIFVKNIKFQKNWKFPEEDSIVVTVAFILSLLGEY